MYKCESWILKKAKRWRIDAFQFDFGEDSCPLDCKEIKPASPKRNQPWIFTGRTDAEAEAPVICLPDVMSQITEKAPNVWKDWGQEEGGGWWQRIS